MSQEVRRGRPGQEAPSIKIAKLILRDATFEAIHFRAVQQTFLEASILYWRRRAADFAAVGTPRCDEIAQACRNHARLVSGEFGEAEPWPGWSEDLLALVGGVV
jgi:hypothetical protein